MNHFLVEGPALISFSGGRTSAFLLRQILDAHAGRLPADVHVAFCNTGKERIETLDFVRECGERWGVKIHWLEFTVPTREQIDGLADLGVVRAAVALAEAAGGTERQIERRRRRAFRAAIRAPHAEIRFREVSYHTAARRGEPFAQLIKQRNFLPNPITRFCTQELKIRVAKHYMQSRGYETWTAVLGIRADEPHRVAKVHGGAERECYDVTTPLVPAGITKPAISAWWSAQPFDLRLKPWEGNCDVCFLKGWAKRSRIARDRPDLVTWWAEAEAEAEAIHRDVARHRRYSRFRKDTPSYAQLATWNHVHPPLLAASDFDGAADLDEPDALAMCAGCMD